MIVYWAMFGLPALSALVMGARRTLARQGMGLGLILLLCLFTILIGLRHQVGTDWFNYQRAINRIAYTGFSGAMSYKDPGFGLVSWLSIRFGWGIYGADFFCGAVLMFGLAKFARRQPDTWLTVTAAVPYLVIVVGMGLVRQAAAIGFVLLALIHFERRAYAWFIGWIAAAAAFHASALCVLPLGAAVIVRKRLVLLIPLGFASILLYFMVLQERLGALDDYTESGTDSSGALVRIAMNAVPAALFFLLRSRFQVDSESRLLWTYFSLVSLLMVAALYFIESSTLVDRLGLYFIPLQLFVFGHLPVVMKSSVYEARMISFFVIIYYALVLYVWLNYADNAAQWVPYRFLPGIF